jgi:hypothetical protein
MDKGTFEFPREVYDISMNSLSTNFNISGDYFEFYFYVLPDTYSSGSYRITYYLEETYNPNKKEIPQNNNASNS